MNIENVIKEYLSSKREDWASSTQTSEMHRLESVKDLLDGNPETLWNGISGLAKYSKVTVWSRVTALWDFCVDHGYTKGPNPYRAFRTAKSARFKNAYTRKTPDMSFDEARSRLESISDPAVRAHALFILYTGARFGESCTVGSDGTVTGKGGRVRTLHVPPGLETAAKAPYHRVRRALAGLGLKPHMLRKILLTRLAALGADVFELCEIAGWSSPAPAMSYVRAAGVKQLMNTVQGGTLDVRNRSTQEQIPTVLPGEPGPHTRAS
jgi:integrase